MANQVQVTLKRSLIGRPENQRATVYSLGLRKVNHSVLLNDSPSVRGMINQVGHLLEVKEV
jgi:large subunit ribosomal protein L30